MQITLLCLPQYVRDFLTVFVLFSFSICQTWRAASSTSGGMQQGISHLSTLVNVGETVLVTSMLSPSAANSLALLKGENKT